jgi:phenylacetate-coenzyme A ligase PaaK-like adenylate-forming protein
LFSYKSFIQQLPHLNRNNFEEFAIQLFRHQVTNNTLYSKYTRYLGINSDNVTSLHQIPFIPVEFFKRHILKTEGWDEETIFTSSGTTGSKPSRHYVRDLSAYLSNTQRIFREFYGSPEDYHIFGLLPSYLERHGSSLVVMVSYLQELSKSSFGGFYLDDHESLIKNMKAARKASDRTILLIGVSFALLDFSEIAGSWPDIILMETGGMKGRRKEMTREELHVLLKDRFKLNEVHSEYGMTEMFSQAYARSGGIFIPGNTMGILLRDPNDPLDVSVDRQRGGINVIDLANVHSCAFLATDDLGIRENDRAFKVLGRLDNSDIRGCNLMVD